MNRYVYVGPTLALNEVTRLAPEVVVRPPVRHGDLLREPFEPGDRVLIVDGLFHQSAAVRHKEILALLAAGVTVAGASSMGALRAAELDGQGMVGIGAVYRMYRSGQVVRDDEVAVVHGEAPDYRQRSVPLVNIRYGLGSATSDGVITPTEAADLLRLAEDLPYAHRSWRALSRVANGIGPEVADAMDRVTEAIRREPARFDAKGSDARSALSWLVTDAPADSSQPAWAAHPGWRSRYLREWIAEFRGADVEDSFASAGSAVRFLQIYDNDFPDQWTDHVLGQLPGGRGDRAGDVDAFLADEYGLRYSTLSPEQRSHWLTESEQRALPATDALVRILVRSAPIPPARVLPQADLPMHAFQAAAESAEVNRQVAEEDPANSTSRLRHEALIEHLAEIWGIDPSDTGSLTGTSRDRGFHDLADAVAAARFFYLRHLLLVAPAEIEAVA